MDKEQTHYIAVTGIVRNKEGKYLICKRSPNEKAFPNKWCVPGGKLEQSDFILDPKDTSDHWLDVFENVLKKEIREETGYDAKISYLLRIKDSPKRLKEDRQNIAFVFVATSAKKTGKSDSESSEVKWFELNKLPKPNEFAFDHYADIQMYLKQLNKLSQK